MVESLTDIVTERFAQSAAMGALPTEYAAVAPDVHGGDYIGPDGIAEMWGIRRRSAAVRPLRTTRRRRGCGKFPSS